MASKVTTNAFLQAIKTRRTTYPLTKSLGSVTPQRIQELVKESTLHTPSPFNSQSNRVLVLFGAEHDKLWDMTTSILKDIVPADKWQPTADKMSMFKAAAGTVLFFDDQDSIHALQEQFAMLADKFPTWASQSLAMQQHTLWTALHLEGLGANLQHYNPLVDQKVAETWGVPASWRLNAQLVFGGRSAEPGEKTFKPVEERVKVSGA